MSEEIWNRLPDGAPQPGEIRVFVVAGIDVLLCNVDGNLYAVENMCSHAGATLDDGTLRGCVLECPLHGGKLDVRNGEAVEPPIRRPVASYPVRRVGETIEVLLPGD
jgi:naphthalene 1,2-dioxygenase system ferredoxin subunit